MKIINRYIRSKVNPNITSCIVILILASALETLSIASLIPLMQIISGDLTSLPVNMLIAVFEVLFATDSTFILFYSACTSVFLIILSAVINSLSLYKINKFSFRQGRQLSLKLFETYITAKFSWLRTQDVSELQRKVVPEIDRVSSGVFIASLLVIQKSTSSVLLVTLMLIADKWLTFIILLFGVLTYLAVFMVLRGKFRENSRNVIRSNESRLRLTLEAFDGIKDLKLNDLGPTFLERFKEESLKYSENQSSYLFLTQSTKYIIEAFGIIILLSYVLISLILSLEDLNQLLQNTIIVALGGYRLIPAFQTVYTNINNINHNLPALRQIDVDFNIIEKDFSEQKTEGCNFKATILSNVAYKYETQDDFIFKNLNYKLNSGELIAICGPSGTGKSTLIDVIAKLLHPTVGEVKYEFKNDKKNIRAPILSYVTQSPKIFNGTVTENVTLFEDEREIDFGYLEACLLISQIDTLNGKQTIKSTEHLGDRGSKLSGGQRQRIAIARALYRKPDMLLLDEATTGIDKVAQSKILKNIKKEYPNTLIILISHDPKVLKMADHLINLSNE